MGKRHYSSIVNIIIIALVIMFSVFTVMTISNNKSGTTVGGGGAGMGGGGPGMGGGAPPGGSGTAITASALSTATAVRVTPVMIDTIENNLIITGDVLSSAQLSVFPSVSGIVTEVRVRVGDTVRRGQTVAVIDPSRPGDLYNQSAVNSTSSGTVLQVLVNPGDTVSTATTVIIVGDASDILIETFIPERFSVLAKTGMIASVSFEAMPNEIFTAFVSELSPVLDPATRTVRTRLRFTTYDPRVRPGMFATINLVIGSHENVPVVPRGAVINTYGNWIVYVLSSRNMVERREIEIGFESDDFIEIMKGLVPGERVVTAGQSFLSDGDPVRVIE